MIWWLVSLSCAAVYDQHMVLANNQVITDCIFYGVSAPENGVITSIGNYQIDLINSVFSGCDAVIGLAFCIDQAMSFHCSRCCINSCISGEGFFRVTGCTSAVTEVLTILGGNAGARGSIDERNTWADYSHLNVSRSVAETGTGISMGLDDVACNISWCTFTSCTGDSIATFSTSEYELNTYFLNFITCKSPNGYTIRLWNTIQFRWISLQSNEALMTFWAEVATSIPLWNSNWDDNPKGSGPKGALGIRVLGALSLGGLETYGPINRYLPKECLFVPLKTENWAIRAAQSPTLVFHFLFSLIQ